MPYSTGKIAVITGAGSGIGRALAQHLNSEGCELYLSDINAQSLNETLASLNSSIAADTQVLDVADRDGVHAWAERIASEKGHVDLVVNNAGVALMATAENSSYEDLDWLMGINFWGVVHGSKAFLPLLRKAEQGHLVNISSIFGVIGVPTQSRPTTRRNLQCVATPKHCVRKWLGAMYTFAASILAASKLILPARLAAPIQTIPMKSAATSLRKWPAPLRLLQLRKLSPLSKNAKRGC